jgi:thiol:disulfide interchange protein
MPRLRIPAVALIAFLPLASCARPGADTDSTRSSGPGVAFASGSYDEALAKARAEKKLLLVDVYTDWCGWCKKLDREVLGDARVARAASSLVAVRVNAEKEGEEVARKFEVQGFPTILFVDGSGTVVERVEGYVDVDEMLRILAGLPKA